MGHVSLKDVAARAGVSFQTAGKALNGNGRVAPATRRRVVAAADALGYVPNRLARGLITRSTCTIGVLASEFSDTVLTQEVVGIEREARRHGLAVIVVSVDRDGTDGEACLRTLLERRVDGIVTVAPLLEHDARIGELLRGNVPTVSLHDVHGGSVPIVRADNVGSGLLATKHLLALGHTRIGCVTGMGRRRVTRDRIEGYRQALAAARIPIDASLLEEGDWEVEGGYAATHRLLDRESGLTALFVHNDAMAIGALAALHDRGLTAPKDCAVVGCDDVAVAARTIPPLTTIRVPFIEIGATAVRVLLDAIAGEISDAPKAELPVHLIYRASSGGQMNHDARSTDEALSEVDDPLQTRVLVQA